MIWLFAIVAVLYVLNIVVIMSALIVGKRTDEDQAALRRLTGRNGP